MSLKRTISTGSLRRSSRTGVLKQNAEAQKALMEQNRESKKPLKKNQNINGKKTNTNKKTTNTKTKSVEGNDDGFILDDGQFPTPKFDELQIWKQYQHFGDDIPDDGFILDNDNTSSPDVHDVASKRKRKLPGNAGKKHSRKKQRKAERKWLKKLFHQSVVIAEPQAADSGASEVSTLSADEESITIQVPVNKTAVLNDREYLKNGNGVEQSPAITSIGREASIQDVIVPMKPTSPNISRKADDDANRQYDKANEIQEEWESLQLSSGLSVLEFKECLLKQYKEKCQNGKAPPTTCDKPAGEVSTRYIDLTSGKCETGDQKKRYKMELSLPEKTTILVTNLVQRDSPLPKVIFMLKKSSSDGDDRGTPLLMECSGGANKQHGGSQVALQKELQEITQQFLRLSNKPEVDTTKPRPIPEAIEFSMATPNK